MQRVALQGVARWLYLHVHALHDGSKIVGGKLRMCSEECSNNMLVLDWQNAAGGIDKHAAWSHSVRIARENIELLCTMTCRNVWLKSPLDHW